MRREVCGGCNSTNLHTVLDLGASPLAGKFPMTPDEDQPHYPLELLRCFRCTLVQLADVVPDDLLWRDDYGFYSGGSWVLVEQQKRYAQWVMQDFRQLCREGVLEIACNDGSMLTNFKEAGYPALGIDPALGPTSVAIKRGLDVWVEGFGTDAALRIVAQHGHQGVVVANNVVAHVADLDDFIEGIAIVLGTNGVAILEFQYLVDLVTGNQIDHVYHEHRQFFSLTSLKYALERHGLRPQSVIQTSPQGGSLRVTVHRDSYSDHSVNHLLHDEAWLGDEHALAGMQGRANRIRSRLRDMLWDQKLANKRVAGYGAPAKATTLLSFCGIDKDLIQYVTDTTPTKHGRYIPGTSIPIISPSADSRAPDMYLLFLWNYLPEVIKQEALFTSHGGHWLVPIPNPVMI
jgi:C-methyltransferase C-terminal domain/Putative zinc binding domain/Methyltransferase domain